VDTPILVMIKFLKWTLEIKTKNLTIEMKIEIWLLHLNSLDFLFIFKLNFNHRVDQDPKST
jgi:hypothetical protein